MKKLICIDVGTQSLRSSVFDIFGQVYYMASEGYSPDFYPGNRAQQDTETWKHALYSTLTQVGAEIAKDPESEILGIAITSQRASVIPMDADGNPLHPALMWQDKRATRECLWIESIISKEELYTRCGLRLDPYFSLPKMLYFRDQMPEIWSQTKKLIGVQDYVTYLLTGRYVTDHSQACRTMLMDLRQFEWDLDLLKQLGLSRDLLCDLVPPGGQAGVLLKEMAEMTGLPEELPVILCGGDQQCAAVALGLYESGRVTTNTGTGSFVLGYAPKPIFDKEQRIVCSAGAIPGTWIVEAGIYASGATYQWCRKQLFTAGDGLEVPFETVNEAVLAEAPGAGGLIVLPHFQGAAAPYWNPISKGVIFNMGLSTTRGQICRGILEGIAAEIADNIGLIEENIGEVKHIFSAGGLTKFDTYCQILADHTRHTVWRTSNAEATLKGCLIGACVALGVYPDTITAWQEILSGGAKAFTPIEKNAVIYAQARKMKGVLYRALKEQGLFEMAQALSTELDGEG